MGVPGAGDALGQSIGIGCPSEFWPAASGFTTVRDGMDLWHGQRIIITADMDCGMGCSESISCGKVGGSVASLWW